MPIVRTAIAAAIICRMIVLLEKRSELEPCRDLQLPWRPRGDGHAKQRRTERADVGSIVDAVEQVEGIESERDRARLLACADLDVARGAQVERRVAIAFD